MSTKLHLFCYVHLVKEGCKGCRLCPRVALLPIASAVEVVIIFRAVLNNNEPVSK